MCTLKNNESAVRAATEETLTIFIRRYSGLWCDHLFSHLPCCYTLFASNFNRGSLMASLSDSLVRNLLEGRYIAAFSSHNEDGSIHIVSVWYLFDGSSLYIATSSRSRKARNVRLNSSVSLMVDSRDVAASCGVNVSGTGEILQSGLSKQWVERVHHKYLTEAALRDAKVGPVFAAADDVAIKITPASVISWDMRAIDQQYFGGAIGNNPGYLLPLAC